MSAPLFFMAPGAPTPVAPFSHAVEVDGWIFVTGQMPTYPDDDSRPLAPDVESQTVRVMENLKICARVYITDFEVNYPRMNKIYASYFPGDRRPARTCIGVTGLARGAMVEIDLLAKR